MRSFVPILAVLFSLLPVLGRAQSTKASAKNWRQQLYGVWKIDSIYEGSGHTPDQSEELDRVIFNFLPEGLMIYGEQKELYVSEYQFLEGSNGEKYLAMKEYRMEFVRIETTDKDHFVVTTNLNGEEYYTPYPVRAYFSRVTDATTKAIPDLSGTWHEERMGLDADTAPEPTAAAQLILDSLGRMSHTLHGTKDTGSWALNKTTLKLVLKGHNGTDSFRVSKLQHHQLVLRPLNKGVEKILKLRKEYAYTEEDISSYADTLMPYAVDTAAVTVEEGSTYTDELLATWRAEEAYELTADTKGTLAEPIQLTFLKDGALQLQQGKKTWKGQWQRNTEMTSLVLTLKGKEQAAAYTMRYGSYEDVSADGHELHLSFLMPGTRKVYTYIFKPYKLR